MSNPRVRPGRGTVVLLTLCVGGLWSCDRESAPAAPAAQQAAAQPQKAPAPSSADMTSAVSASSGTAPVDLKFEIAARPEVGKPVAIHLALIPKSRLERVIASFQASEGLELRDGARTALLPQVDVGRPVSHTVTIVPERDGIFHVTATVHADSPTVSATHTFSIPVIAGAGIAAAAGKPALSTPRTVAEPVAGSLAAEPRQSP